MVLIQIYFILNTPFAIVRFTRIRNLNWLRLVSSILYRKMMNKCFRLTRGSWKILATTEKFLSTFFCKFCLSFPLEMKLLYFTPVGRQFLIACKINYIQGLNIIKISKSQLKIFLFWLVINNEVDKCQLSCHFYFHTTLPN